MPHFMSLNRLAVQAIGVLALTVGLIGCDFQRYDHGADAPTATHLEALAKADSQDDAEHAIRAALNKVGVDWTRQDTDDNDGYTDYAPDADAIEDLAAVQAAFVRGEHAGFTLQETYDRVLATEIITEEIDQQSQSPVALNRPDVEVPLGDALRYFNAAATAAQQYPEEAGNALLLLTANRGTVLEQAAPALDTEARFSPVQQLFFMMWLHRNGPYMVQLPQLPDSPIEEGAAVATPPKGSEVDLSLPGQRTGDVNGCCAGSGKITSITLIYLGHPGNVSARVINPGNKQYQAMDPTPLAFGTVFTVTGAGRVVNGGFTGTLGNELQLSVGGSTQTSERIHTSCSQPVYPGQAYGRFVVLATQTKNGPGCNNLNVCLLGCKAQFLTCLGCDPSDSRTAECMRQYRDCDLNCHDQGGGR